MTHRSITTTLTFALVAGSAVFAAVPAAASTSARVAYTDLDLGSAVGQRTLARRLSSAVSAVCPAQAGNWSAETDCRRTALGRARSDLAKAGAVLN